MRGYGMYNTYVKHKGGDAISDKYSIIFVNEMSGIFIFENIIMMGIIMTTINVIRHLKKEHGY